MASIKQQGRYAHGSGGIVCTNPLYGIMVICAVAINPLICDRTFASVVGKATSSRAAREDAIRSIPFDRLTEDVQERITDIVHRPTIFRRMPIKVIDCDPELYRFLVRYPEVVVNIWKLMNITNVSLQRTGRYTLDAADGAGTISSMELVYGTQDTHLIYCDGAYEGPLFRRPVNGRCVLLLKSGFVETEKSRTHVVNRLDVFLQLDHAGAEVLTKTLHPLVGRSADVNFLESTEFLQRISRTAEQNGPGMQRLALRLDDVHDAVRRRFADLMGTVNANATQSQALHVPGGGLSNSASVEATARAPRERATPVSPLGSRSATNPTPPQRR